MNYPPSTLSCAKARESSILILLREMQVLKMNLSDQKRLRKGTTHSFWTSAVYNTPFADLSFGAINCIDHHWSSLINHSPPWPVLHDRNKLRHVRKVHTDHLDTLHRDKDMTCLIIPSVASGFPKGPQGSPWKSPSAWCSELSLISTPCKCSMRFTKTCQAALFQSDWGVKQDRRKKACYNALGTEKSP